MDWALISRLRPLALLIQRNGKKNKKIWPAVFGNWIFEQKRVVGFEDLSGFLTVTKGLVALDYSESDIRKTLGENFVKLCEKVWGK